MYTPDDANPEVIRANIKQAVRMQQMTRPTLARLTRIPRKDLTEAFSGFRNFSAVEVGKIAMALNMTYSGLVRGTFTPATNPQTTHRTAAQQNTVMVTLPAHGANPESSEPLALLLAKALSTENARHQGNTATTTVRLREAAVDVPKGTATTYTVTLTVTPDPRR